VKTNIQCSLGAKISPESGFPPSDILGGQFLEAFNLLCGGGLFFLKLRAVALALRGPPAIREPTSVRSWTAATENANKVAIFTHSRISISVEEPGFENSKPRRFCFLPMQEDEFQVVRFNLKRGFSGRTFGNARSGRGSFSKPAPRRRADQLP